jgi:hypothetical protein
MHSPAKRLVAGYVIASAGVLLAISGGTWDVTNHLLNRPETFFSPPHAALYSGVAIALAGSIIAATSARATKIDWTVKLMIVGIALLLSAGPVDYAWHSRFGLDGLLSPPHGVLISGIVASAAGAMIGIITAYGRAEQRPLPTSLLIIGMLPVWVSAAGALHMFSLPFSHTGFFDFDPDPQAAVVLATLGFPFVTAAILVTTAFLAGRKFGAMSALAAAFVFVGALTSIVQNEALVPTLPFYVSAIIPIIAADAILARWVSPKATYLAGAIAGLAFIVLYYPLITHTYNEALMPQRAVWASLTAEIYFEMLGTIFPLVAAPAAAMGVVGALVGQRLAQRAELALLK